MKNKKAKQLLVNGCITVSFNGEVHWVNRVIINAGGSTLVFKDYLGDLDDSVEEVARRCKVFNLPKKDLKGWM